MRCVRQGLWASLFGPKVSVVRFRATRCSQRVVLVQEPIHDPSFAAANHLDHKVLCQTCFPFRSQWQVFHDKQFWQRRCMVVVVFVWERLLCGSMVWVVVVIVHGWRMDEPLYLQIRMAFGPSWVAFGVQGKQLFGDLEMEINQMVPLQLVFRQCHHRFGFDVHRQQQTILGMIVHGNRNRQAKRVLVDWGTEHGQLWWICDGCVVWNGCRVVPYETVSIQRQTDMTWFHVHVPIAMTAIRQFDHRAIPKITQVFVLQIVLKRTD